MQLGFHGLLKPWKFYWSTSGDPVLAELWCSELSCCAPSLAVWNSWFRLWPAAAEGKGCWRGQSCSRGPCACALHPCMSWPRGCCGSVPVLSAGCPTSAPGPQLSSFTPFGTWGAQSRMEPRAAFVLWGCPRWNLLLADTASSYTDTVISSGILHCIYIFSFTPAHTWLTLCTMCKSFH